METKVLEERVYYRIESPRGVMSDCLTENDVRHCREQGYFTHFIWRGDDMEAFSMRRYKIGKIYKYTRKTTLSEEIVA